MKLGIVGGGTVGRAVARTYIEHVEEVRVYDVMPERRTHPLEAVLTCDLIMVCLPTPQRTDGDGYDLSFVESFFAARSLTAESRARCYVIRSTVPIGTTKRLSREYGLTSLAHSPEFLTARIAETDAAIPARNIIGVPEPHNNSDFPHLFTGDNRAAQELNILCHQRFPGVPMHFMTSDESEAVKLYQNGFFSCKIAYFNEIWTLAHKFGLNWERILAGMLADGRIEAYHTRVPGHDGYGFAGACLPKDLSALICQLQENGLDAAVTLAAQTRNKADRARAIS